MTALLTFADGRAASRLAQLSVCEAVQAIEADGPLDDAAALQTAAASGANRSQQLLIRAWLLGQRLGLPWQWQHWRQLGTWVVVALAVLVALSAWGVAQTVVGQARRINAMAALVSVLGLHGLTLALWLLGLLWTYASSAASADAGAWSLGAWALRLTARLPLDRGPHAAALLHGLLRVLRGHRLAPWAFGMVSHAIWALAFVLMLIALWFGFSFHAYRLSWETTILSDAFFERFVQVTGWLPGHLGFPVPDAAAVHAVGSSAGTPAASGVQSEWAWWLMGCTLCYGLLPRLLLAAWCGAVWQYRQRAIGPDLTAPAARKVLARLDALQRDAVWDPEHAGPGRVAANLPGAATGAPAIVGFELPPDWHWTTDGAAPAWARPAHMVERLSGSAAGRDATLQRLRAERPRRLLLVVWGASSPDRGTARFIRDAGATAGELALWLAPDAAQPALSRWQNWIEAERLGNVPVWTDATQAGAWLAGHEPAAPQSSDGPRSGAGFSDQEAP